MTINKRTNDNFGDWRIRAVLTLGKDIPPAFPSGPSHKKGSPVYLVHSARIGKKDIRGFITPDASALALDISMLSTEKAIRFKEMIKYKNIISSFGEGISVTEETTPYLYDYFENFMITVIFSFLAVEAYVNAMITLDQNQLFEFKKKKMRVYEIERALSTDEKIKYILPQITNKNIQYDSQVWQNFLILKQVRDSIVHLKYKDLFSSEDTIDDNSLYFHFLSKNPLPYTLYGYEIIKFFEDNENQRWMISFKEKYDKLCDKQ